MLSVVEIEPWSESPVHSHPNEQWGICLKGEWIRIQDGKEFKVKAGHFWETPSATAFRIDGAIVGRLQAGRARKPVAYGSDRVVVREEDEDGVVSMKVFRIMPASRP